MKKKWIRNLQLAHERDRFEKKYMDGKPYWTFKSSIIKNYKSKMYYSLLRLRLIDDQD